MYCTDQAWGVPTVLYGDKTRTRRADPHTVAPSPMEHKQWPPYHLLSPLSCPARYVASSSHSTCMMSTMVRSLMGFWNERYVLRQSIMSCRSNCVWSTSSSLPSDDDGLDGEDGRGGDGGDNIG